MKTITETPGERADRLHAEGYQLQRTPECGVYLLTKPDRSRTYRVDVPAQTCNCQSTAWWGCKHLLYAHWWYDYDRCALALEEARRRDVLVDECESAAWAAKELLRRRGVSLACVVACKAADRRRAA